MNDNRREFFRVDFDQMINGEISIRKGAFIPIKIENLGVGGMSFVSEEPLSTDDVIDCRFQLLESILFY